MYLDIVVLRSMSSVVQTDRMLRADMHSEISPNKSLTVTQRRK